MDGMAYAALAYSTIAKGRIASLDTSAAEAAPGRGAGDDAQERAAHEGDAALHVGAQGGRRRQPAHVMQDDRIHWNGQPIALVLAETQEQADHARSLIRVTYESEPSTTSLAAAKAKGMKPGSFQGEPLKLEIGDAEAALAAAPAQDRRRLHHAAPQPQRHRAARGHAGLERRRRADDPRRVARRRAHGVVAGADLRA